MTTIDQVIAANESLNAAVEAYRITANYRSFGKMSLALEESVQEDTEEKKKTMLQRLRSFIAKIINWFKDLFKKKKESIEEKVEVAVKETEEQAAKRKEWDEEIQKATRQNNALNTLISKSKGLVLKNIKSLSEKYEEIYNQQMPAMSAVVELVNDVSPELWRSFGTKFHLSELLLSITSFKSTCEQWKVNTSLVEATKPILDRIDDLAEKVSNTSKTVSERIGSPKPNGKVAHFSIKMISRFKENVLGTMDVTAMRLGDLEDVGEEIAKKCETPDQVGEVQRVISEGLTKLGGLYDKIVSIINRIAAEFGKIKSINNGMVVHIEALDGFDKIIEDAVEPTGLSKEKLKERALKTMCYALDDHLTSY